MTSSRNVAQIFLEVAKKFSDRPALWSNGNMLTYKELLTLTTDMALNLVREGQVKPGDRVAILSEKTQTAYVGILATLFAGGTYVPLNTRFPAARNSLILKRSGATSLICDERHKLLVPELTKDLESPLFLLFPEDSSIKTTNRNEAETDRYLKELLNYPSENYAYLLFTSGSTGVPKGVPISHANMLTYVKNITEICDVSENDRIIQLVDLTFDLSVHDMFMTWLSGACLYVVPEMSTLMATRFVQEYEITGWLSVPSTAALLKQLGELDPESLPSLKFTFFCGEALVKDVADAWIKAANNSVLVNLYGPTEATVAFSFFRYPAGSESLPAVVPLGEPFSGQSMGIFKADGSPCAPKEIGEICLSGNQVTNGYWMDAELNNRKFFFHSGKRWYCTGDLGEYNDTLGFIYRGRIDHQVKIRGYRVELQEIETVVRKASGKDLVAVIPWPTTDEGHATGCIAILTKDKNNKINAESKNSEEILKICSQLLPDYMVPSRILFISEMPLNSNGKVDYVYLKSNLSMIEKAQ